MLLLLTTSSLSPRVLKDHSESGEMYHASASNANPDALCVYSTVTPQSVIRTKPNPKLFKNPRIIVQHLSLSLWCRSLPILQRQDSVSPCLLITRLSHISINRRTKRRKRNAASGHSLRSRILGQDASRQTSRRHAVDQVVLRPQALDAALDSGKQAADLAKVLCHAPGPRAHVLETDFELLAEGERGDGGLAVGALEGTAEGCIVGHLQYERLD